MVSTRQMATSHNGSGASPSGSPHGGIAGDECTRFALVGATISPTVSSVQRGLSLAAGVSDGAALYTSLTPSISGIAAVTGAATGASATCSTRQHTHLTQALKSCVNGGSIVGGDNNTFINTVDCTSVGDVSSGTIVATSQMQLLDLPTEVLEEILSYASYKKIGQLRLVSQKMNDVCMHILNMTFSKLITQTYNHFHAIKGNMPRRESARRNHPLACECDIIETCYMRLSLLQMTFGKHIERGHCCFFPGAILDEVYTILHYIKITPRLERPYSVTDELFDLSTMAMEYFRDRIESTLPGIAYFNKDFFKLPTTTNGPPLVISSDLSDSSSSMPSPPQSNMVLRKGIRKIEQGMKIYNNQLSVLRNELRTCKRKSSEQGKQITEQQKLLAEQQKQTLEYANRLDEMDKKNEEMSRKFSTLLQELNKCKTELQYWRSKSPAMPACTSCGQKMAPVLPPEDYQALINQGVRPEDILLNLNEELDAESTGDADVHEAGGDGLALSMDFALPNEATTAKLLVVNTATRNLKRQHHQINNTTSNNMTTNTSTTIGSNSSNNCDGDDSSSSSSCNATSGVCVDSGQKPIEFSNCLAYAKGGHIIKTTCHTGTAQQDRIKDLSTADAAATAAGGCSDNSGSHSAVPGHGGYSTKLFYGTQAHNGVIVSPAMLAKVTEVAPVVVAEGAGRDNAVVAVADGDCTELTEAAVAAAVALQAFKTHMTKKARRVQKATRCLGGASGTSSSSGKRSK